MTEFSSITETELECVEKFYSRNNDIYFDAHYYVLHSDNWDEDKLTRSEKRKVRSKQKKIKKSYKKQQRRNSYILAKHYCSHNL